MPADDDDEMLKDVFGPDEESMAQQKDAPMPAPAPPTRMCGTCGAEVHAGYHVCPYCSTVLVHLSDKEQREQFTVLCIQSGMCCDSGLCGNAQQREALRKRNNAAPNGNWFHTIRGDPYMCAQIGESKSLPPWVASACQFLWHKGTDLWRARAVEIHKVFSEAKLAKGQPPELLPPVMDTGRFAFDPESVRGQALQRAIDDAALKDAALKKRKAAPTAEGEAPATQSKRPATASTRPDPSKPSASSAKGKGTEKGKGKGKGKTKGKG